MIQPVVNVLPEPVEYMGKMLVVIWVPGGELRPYKAPIHIGKEYQKQGKVYYVRRGSVTCVANQEEEQTLMRLCNKVPFDDRICQTASLDDFNLMYIETSFNGLAVQSLMMICYGCLAKRCSGICK